MRGVKDVKLSGGSRRACRTAPKGVERASRTSLVVGADGRQSTIRKQAGITLERQEPISYIAGLLLEGLDGVPDDHDVLAGEGDLFFVLFHQGGGRARAYVVPGLSGQHGSRARRHQELPRGVRASKCYPWSEQVVQRDTDRPVRDVPRRRHVDRRARTPTASC